MGYISWCWLQRLPAAGVLEYGGMLHVVVLYTGRYLLLVGHGRFVALAVVPVFASNGIL